MLIVLGAVWTALSVVLSRFLIHFVKNKNLRLGTEGVKNLLIVGSSLEVDRVKALLSQAQVVKNIIGWVSLNTINDDEQNLGSVQDLDKIITVFKIQEIIFCSQDIQNQMIINWMERLGTAVEYKILPERSNSIIGSSSKNTSGELYTFETQFKIASPMNRRNKRVFDILICFLTVILSPILIFKFSFFTTVFKNWLSVFIGKKTWIGYSKSLLKGLPKLKEGVFPIFKETELGNLNVKTLEKLNFLYAKDYDVWQDWAFFKKRF
jgi:hypothetical protein